MKAVGELLFIVPVNPEQLERSKDNKVFGVKSNGKREWSILWRVVSVGEGDTIGKQSTEAGFVWRPLRFQVGDIILRLKCDEDCRDEWEKETFLFNGAKAMSIYGRIFGSAECGQVLALVSRNGVEVNDLEPTAARSS
jgi:hypothetical protein